MPNRIPMQLQCNEWRQFFFAAFTFDHRALEMYTLVGETQSLIGHRILLLICDERLGLVVRDSCPLSFLHDGEFFRNLGGQDFNGFYDFLRDDSGRILGTSLSVFPTAEFLLDTLRSRSYVEVANPTILRIFFAKERNFEPSISVDQYFGENRIYRSTSGRIALSLSLATLTPAEIRSIPGRAPTDAGDQLGVADSAS